MIQDMSGPGGYFHTDNFISNESGYLHPLPVLRRLDLSRGVYVGVGPEQNFSYIGTIRPPMAFIVDIRRNNLLQHLMYKALFALSDTRAVFLSKLFSKPLYEDLSTISRLFRRTPAWIDAGREASVGELIDRTRRPTKKPVFTGPLRWIRKPRSFITPRSLWTPSISISMASR